jgi:dihydroxyacetone kinase
MTTIFDTPEEFASTALAGFCQIYPNYVRLVANGVVRATTVPKGKVSVVVGGGSGHYPAFAGYVGQGMADAAVAGDVFASPSTAAVARVCRRAHSGGGIILGFGNYAGDVLNFGVAAERLRAEGIDVRIIAVTDDVASASAGEHTKRRGIAGDLMVFKIAGAAAEAGLSLDEVERVARHANERTVSFGVAFAGCTLPGARVPLFTVPTGCMALGLGIHGEPGISEQHIASATDLADVLADKLLAERPHACKRVAAVLNGLGSTKYEELFVLWTAVQKKLTGAGLEIVQPEAGEFVTSLDMQGCSLTLTWLDEELERYWAAPCDAPAFRRGRPDIAALCTDVIADEEAAAVIPASSAASRKSASCIRDLFAEIATMLKDKEAELGRIDAIAGDGDHGQGMQRGSDAAAKAMAAAVSAGAGAKTTLALGGDAWADRAGGTAGALWGLLLRSWSDALSDSDVPDGVTIADGARRALDGVTSLGRARVGDKTLVDSLVPFVDILAAQTAAGQSLAEAWKAAADASDAAAQATASLTPRLGRARPLAQRSVGHPDAGAISLSMVAQLCAGFIAGRR